MAIVWVLFGAANDIGSELLVQDLMHKSLVPFCNNAMAVSWVTRMVLEYIRVGSQLAKGFMFRAWVNWMYVAEEISIDMLLSHITHKFPHCDLILRAVLVGKFFSVYCTLLHSEFWQFPEMNTKHKKYKQHK